MRDLTYSLIRKSMCEIDRYVEELGFKLGQDFEVGMQGGIVDFEST